MIRLYPNFRRQSGVNSDLGKKLSMLWSSEINLPRSAADITRCSHSDYRPYATSYYSNEKFVLSEWNSADLEKHIIIFIIIIVIIIETKFETFVETNLYTGCPRRNVPNFGRAFLMLNYTDITQNTYVQS